MSMQMENYLDRNGTMNAVKGAVVTWKIDPNFGWLTVTSEPSGLDAKLDGEIIGKTPVSARPLAPGNHDVLVLSDCHFEIGERIVMERGKERTVNVTPLPRTGKVKVDARDKGGNDVEADVYIDGEKVGTAPGTFKVNVCSKEIEVKGGKNGVYKGKLGIQEKQTIEVAAVLKSGGGVWVDPATGYKWQNPPANNTMNWNAAISHCKNLTHAGNSDWHLPTIDELKTILTKEKNNGCYWKDDLTGECGWYWSSSSYESYDNAAWVVSFKGGDTSDRPKFGSRYVRCVR